jgi:hypothetical protein
MKQKRKKKRKKERKKENIERRKKRKECRKLTWQLEHNGATTIARIELYQPTLTK